MQNIQKARELIEESLSAANLAYPEVFASKIYRDEPILMTAAQLERRTPPEYLEMRRIAQSYDVMDESEAQIFYRQGKFMEDFEDNFDYRGTFAKYFPTYQAMNVSQLRGYFSWRTKVRRGVVEKTQLSFAFVYIYELLNQIGARSPEEGYHKLKNFQAAYGEIDPKINGYVKLWLKDYVVYNSLDKSLLEDYSGADFDSDIHTLLSYKNRGADAVFSALNSLSSYNMEGSGFFKRYPGDVKNVVSDVFSTLSDYFEKHRKNSLCERFFGKIYASSYVMFKSAVFFHQPCRQDFACVYEISGVCKYRCEHGSWTCERFFRSGRKNRRLGALLKNIDFFMRREYGFKSALKAEKMPKVLQGVIAGAIASRLEEKMKAALPKVEIDVSKLRDIRDAALKTQNKLTVEEVKETMDNCLAAPPQTPLKGLRPLRIPFNQRFLNEATINENPGQGASAGLNDAERRFLNCLLRGESYDGLIKTHGLMLSTLVDSINERLFDMFGDTVIVDGENGPALAEDYAGELKGIIEK